MERGRFETRAPQIRINTRIRAGEVRVINHEGAMLGVYSIQQALQLAREADLDLVEVNPKAEPPVCRVMDFGKFKYEEKKKASEARKRQVQVEVKEVKIRPKTDDHDLNFKMKHVKRFLEEGNKAKITVRFRGREISHPEQAQRLLNQFVKAFEKVAIVEQSSRMEGRQMTLLLAPR